jgi:ParB-like chromosome segregation protein Spo0J
VATNENPIFEEGLVDSEDNSIFDGDVRAADAHAEVDAPVEPAARAQVKPRLPAIEYRALDSIRVGRSSRRDLGDIDALAEDIDRRGLINPILITADGLVLDGVRRLAAVRKLGWETIWVRVVESV